MKHNTPGTALRILAGSLSVGLVTFVLSTAAPAGTTGHANAPAGATATTGPTASYLNSVTCMSATMCMAVGTVLEPGDQYSTMSELWNGKSWSRLPSVNPANSTINYLNSVSCTSAKSCMAVGLARVVGAEGFEPLAESWNGATWSVLRAKSPNGSSAFEGVSCSASVTCMAVGSVSPNPQDSRPLAESWDGSTWKVISTPSPGGSPFAFFQGLSCTAAAFCVAVGGRGKDTSDLTGMAQQWDGKKWAATSLLPNPSRTTESSLAAVKCNGQRCMAVGEYTTTAGQAALADAYVDGKWTLTSAAVAAAGSVDSLGSVSCTAAVACVSVGKAGTGSLGLASASWNGTAWKVVAVPTSSSDSDLVSVSCPVGGFCMAVGRSQDAPLAESWNGKSWTSLPSAAATRT